MSVWGFLAVGVCLELTVWDFSLQVSVWSCLFGGVCLGFFGCRCLLGALCLGFFAVGVCLELSVWSCLFGAVCLGLLVSVRRPKS